MDIIGTKTNFKELNNKELDRLGQLLFKICDGAKKDLVNPLFDEVQYELEGRGLITLEDKE
jgi:hypothetical protein